MWTIVNVDEPRREGDSEVHRWNLRQDHEITFTDVRITENARLKTDEDMTPRSLEAVDTKGRSEVERHLGDPHPPRVIEVGTRGDPKVTKG